MAVPSLSWRLLKRHTSNGGNSCTGLDSFPPKSGRSAPQDSYWLNSTNHGEGGKPNLAPLSIDRLFSTSNPAKRRNRCSLQIPEGTQPYLHIVRQPIHKADTQ